MIPGRKRRGLAMSKLYSERKTPPAARYVHALPEKARERLLHILRQHSDATPLWSGRYDFRELLRGVGEQALAKYGRLRATAQYGNPESAVIDHFLSCNDDEALDFIEMCFRTHTMGGDDGAKLAVTSIN